MLDPGAVVRSFFEAMQARRWDEAGSRLSPDLRVWWPATDEHFRGSRFIEMQRAYPEGWSITVEEVLADGGRVAARVRVAQDDKHFWCFGWYEVAGKTITDIVELWGTEAAESPPKWRLRFTE